jgi:hypothetical protein
VACACGCALTHSLAHSLTVLLAVAHQHHTVVQVGVLLVTAIEDAACVAVPLGRVHHDGHGTGLCTSRRVDE